LKRRDETFGPRIRTLRRNAGLTLQELGQRTGIGFSTISKVEKGQLSPTYENILRLAQGLGVDVAELFSPDPSTMMSGRRSVTLSGEGIRQKTPHYIFEMLNTDLRNKKFIPIFAVIQARDIKEFPALTSHAGEEFIYVIKGTIELHTSQYEILHLRAGDSCYFDSQMGHACISVGDVDAEVLWICSSLEVAHSIRMRASADFQEV
jgi:transcriptional regulator with XRE-family HTH domain